MASGDYEKRKEYHCIPRHSANVLQNLIELIEHPISEYAVARQIEHINNYLYFNKYAFWLHDLPYIIRLYEAISNKLRSSPEFKQPFKSLLLLSACPPLMSKFSDSEDYKKDHQQYFSTLGYLIAYLNSQELIELVLNAIISLLTVKTPPDCCYVGLKIRKQAAEMGGLPEILAQLLEVINQQFYGQLLEAVDLLTAISPDICERMAKEQAITYLLTRLEPSWRNRNTFYKPQKPANNHAVSYFEETLKILWKLLNAVKDPHLIPKPTLFALWSLQYAFRWSVISAIPKRNRNNLAAVILKLLVVFSGLPIVESEIANDIIVLGLQMGRRDTRKFLKLRTDEDFQFQKILIISLNYFLKHGAEKMIQDHYVIVSLLQMLSKETLTRERRNEQHCELIKLALKLIPKFLPYGVDYFLQISGHQTLMKMMMKYLDEEYEIDMLYACIYCCCEILFLDYESVNAEIDSQSESLLHNVLILIERLLQHESLKQIHQLCIGRCFCILQKLCSTLSFTANTHTLHTCMNYLNRIISPHVDDVENDPRTTICVLYFLWDSVLTVKKLYKEFLRKGGVYVLLDISECSTLPVKVLAVGALADACEKSASIPYMITWRKRRKMLYTLLLEVFRGETEKSCFSNMKLGLVGKLNNKLLQLCSGKENSVVVPKQTLLEICRPKLQAILLALKIKHKDKAELANNEYRLFVEKFETDDEITMVFLEYYSELKLCEAWVNIAKDIKEEGINPTKEDYDQLMDKIETIRQWRIYLQGAVHDIIKWKSQAERLNEVETYFQLNEAKLSDALEALSDLKYVSHCTEKMFQMRKKMRLSNEVDTIRTSLNINYSLHLLNYHRTISDLPFTNIYDQSVSIQSNIINKEEELFDVELVSVMDEEEEDKFQNVYVDDKKSDITETQLTC